MKPELKKKWLDALESGDYEQGQHRLVMKTCRNERYCCMGVLLMVMGGKLDRDGGVIHYKDRIMAGNLGRLSREEAGLTLEVVDHLTTLNDNGYGFNYIANEIRRLVE